MFNFRILNRNENRTIHPRRRQRRRRNRTKTKFKTNNCYIRFRSIYRCKKFVCSIQPQIFCLSVALRCCCCECACPSVRIGFCFVLFQCQVSANDTRPLEQFKQSVIKSNGGEHRSWVEKRDFSEICEPRSSFAVFNCLQLAFSDQEIHISTNRLNVQFCVFDIFVCRLSLKLVKWAW